MRLSEVPTHEVVLAGAHSFEHLLASPKGWLSGLSSSGEYMQEENNQGAVAPRGCPTVHVFVVHPSLTVSAHIIWTYSLHLRFTLHELDSQYQSLFCAIQPATAVVGA